MFQYKDYGIILKATNFGEADKLLTILSKSKGKIRAIAKGIRKSKAKFSGSLEPFTYCHIMIVQGKKDLDLITGVDVIKSFKNLRTDLKRTATAYLLSELIDKLTEVHQPQFHIFQEFNMALEKLNSPEYVDLTLLKDYFIINILNILGYRPEIKVCQICHQKISGNRDHFSPNLGGVICENCVSKNGEAIPISIESLKIIQLFTHNDINIIDKIPDKNKKELSGILEMFLQYISERKIKSLKFYNHILQEEK
jgi:DNA repair protein RecO (recombination protein O)